MPSLTPSRFAPVAPIQILEELLRLDRRHLFGDYHLLLAHHTVAHPTRFIDLFHKRMNGGVWQEIDVIMDNSIVELGGAVDDDMIRKAVNIIFKAHEHGMYRSNKQINVIPVLPDVMGDGEATRQLSAEGYARWAKGGMPGDSFMLVTQGRSFADFRETVDFFLVAERERFEEIGWVGIPRVLVQSMNSRKPAVRYIRMIRPDIKIHLLGFSDNMLDDVLCARMHGVQGIDSAVPVRCNMLLTPSMDVPPRDPKWFEEGALTRTEEQNIRNVRQWIDNHGMGE